MSVSGVLFLFAYVSVFYLSEVRGKFVCCRKLVVGFKACFIYYLIKHLLLALPESELG